MKLAPFALTLAFAFSPVAIALAEEGGSPAPASAPEGDAETSGPKMDLSVAPPAPSIQRSAYVHEGFYLRFGVGPGVMWSNLSREGASSSAAGFALAGDVMVGGSPSPGLALGIGALTTTGVGMDFGDGSVGQFSFLVGPFFDAFPNNRKGFHLGAEAGFAGSTLDALSGAYGGGAAAWIGYDEWVAPDWGVGGALRGGGAYMAGNGGELANFQLTLVLSLLRH